MNKRLKPLVASATLGLLVAFVPATPSAATIAATPPTAAVASPAQPSAGVVLAAKKYKNCAALNKVYHHGVGKKGARDKVSGRAKPVTSFKKDNTLYKRNSHLDRDKDGVACEKR